MKRLFFGGLLVLYFIHATIASLLHDDDDYEDRDLYL